MASGKYVIPVILGRAGRELFYVKGDIPRNQGLVMARQVDDRGVTERDRKQLAKMFAGRETYIQSFNRVRELQVVSTEVTDLIDPDEATLVYGYITNTLPGAFKALALNQWYIFERPGELTPLKLARFVINLLDPFERRDLIAPLREVKLDTNHQKFKDYR